MKIKMTMVMAGMVVLVMLGACSNTGDNLAGGGTDLNTNKDIGLVPASTPEEMNTAVRAVMIRNMESQLDQMKKQCKSSDYPIAYAAPSEDDASSESTHFTDTNIQEAGVDESDLIKTDGKYVYTLAGGKLRITKAWPAAEFKLVGELALKDEPLRMVLDGSTLVVFSRSYATYGSGVPSDNGIQLCVVAPTSTQVSVIDVRNPAQPKVIRETVFRGQLASERRVGHQVYAILDSYLAGMDEQEYVQYVPYGERPECDDAGHPIDSAAWNAKIESIKEKNRAIIAAHDFSKQFPALPEGSSARYYSNTTANSLSVMQLLTFSTETPSLPGDLMMVLGGAGTVYASEKSLYVAGANYFDDDTTTIHHFILGPRSEYAGSGKVGGHLINQFAMSEYNGVLRVATTKGGLGWTTNPESESAVYMLDATSAQLTNLGQITGLGKGEKIYSVRFIGPRGFVVTFKTIDPLFVLNLRDPKNPSVTGELKAPGVSTYLHPMGESHLIGVGPNILDDGNTVDGFKLSLFDVSDSTSPKEVQSMVIGKTWYSNTPAMLDHHAFTFDPKSHLLALPVRISEDYTSHKDGLQLYHVSADKGFELLGSNVKEGGNTPLRAILMEDAQHSSVLSFQNEGLSLHQRDAQLTTEGTVTWSDVAQVQKMMFVQ